MDKVALGRRIRTAREAAGLTQGRLAEIVGARQTTVSDWETGKNEPTLDAIARVADACGWEMTFALTPPGARTPIGEIAAAVVDLDHEKLAILLQIARAVSLLPMRRCRRLARAAMDLVEDMQEDREV